MKKIRWDIAAVVVGSSLLAWFLFRQTWEIATAIRERPALLKKVERLERERDSLMDELWVRDVEMTRMTLSIEESMTEEEQKKFWEWMSRNTE